MNILQIYKDYFPVLGGIENHLRDLSEGLVARGHRVTVLVTNQDRRTLIEYPSPGLTIVKAGCQIRLASTPLSLAMLPLAGLTMPDIVHLHFPYPPGDLAALVVPHRPPLVVTYHSDIVRQQVLLRAYRPLLLHTLRRAARIMATSPNYMASSIFLQPYAEKCRVVPLGIDPGRFAGVEQAAGWRAGAEKVVLFVGRLRYYKGLHILLDAMPHISATLLLAGSGPERQRLEEQARALKIMDRVRFLGDVPDADLPGLYHSADVFVLPAHLRAEALGLAQIEAMACGIPCVSTELGTGTSFANQHNETGLVVPPGDPHQLAGAINSLLADPDLRRCYGAAARRRVDALFTRDHMLDGVEAVYREVWSSST